MTSDRPRVCPSCGSPVASDARFCASCGAALGPPAAEERKLATILFADVSGSTEIGEQLDPERLRALLAEYFAAMSRVIEEWGGTTEKYIGDAILAVFGVPAAREDDPVRALRAASEMLALLERLNDSFEERHGVRVSIRIGVNTGEVLAPMGARQGGQFLVSGDPVNVAARLEQAAEPSTIVVGERTWAAARHAFEFGQPVSLTLKGKLEPVVARTLGPQLSSTEQGVQRQAPMVGRGRELETLLGLLDESIETEAPRLVVVSGPAGIGKSRLLREFIAGAKARHDDVAVLRGRCLAAGHGITFWALGEILRAACGISLDEPADNAVEKLRRSVTSMVEPLGLRPADIDATVFALATSANLGVAGNPLERLEPEAVADEMSRAWPRLLSGLAARAPTVIVVEDVHWADERMVAMLELLAARSNGRLMIIATARPEFIESHPGFGQGADLTVVALRPLTAAQSELLIAELLGEIDELASILDEVRRKAEGNPLFLEEIVQRLVDEGAIAQREGRWHSTDRAASVNLPDTIHALLAARIDGLPTAEKLTLQQAAVVGRTFWPGSLKSAVNGGTGELLRSLERRGLVTARPVSTIEGEPEYAFRHVLIRDVAYASVPKARRARAHAETGRWIENLAGDRLEEFGELLAYHYTAAAAGDDADLAWADRPDEQELLRRRAFEVLIRSGAAARRRFVVDKAISLHEQALALAADDDERARAQEAIGDDHEALFHMDEAVSAYFAALEAVKRSSVDPETIGKLAVKLGSSAKRWGAFRETPPHVQIRAVIDDALKRDVSERTRAELLFAAGSVTGQSPRRARPAVHAIDRDDLPAVIASVNDGLAIARRLDDAVLLYQGYEALQQLTWTAGDIDGYRAVIEEEALLLDQLPSRREKVDALTGIASARIEAGLFRQGLEAAEQGFELADGLSAHERMHTSFPLMWAAYLLGEWDRALEVLPWHLEAAAAEEAVTCPHVRGGPPLGATILIRRGELERARELVPVDESAVSRETLIDRGLVARQAALLGRADVAAAIVDRMADEPERMNYPDGMESFLETLTLLGKHEQMARFAERARQLGEADVLLGPLADRTQAHLLSNSGRKDEARQLLESALTRFDELSVPFEAARTRELLAQLVEPGRRRQLLEEALETYERLRALPSAEQVHELIARLEPAGSQLGEGGSDG